MIDVIKWLDESNVAYVLFWLGCVVMYGMVCVQTARIKVLRKQRDMYKKGWIEERRK
jgi:hypothetical protein